MKKVAAIFCTLFVFLFSGYAQSNRLGIYLNPHHSFFNKKITPETGNEYSLKGKGLMFCGGAYFEGRVSQIISASFGVGYTHLKVTLSDSVVGGITTKKGFVSIPLGLSYEYPITEDKFIVGLLGKFSFEYLVSEKQNDISIELSRYKTIDRLSFMGSVGINVMYYFTDNFGAAITPNFSFLLNVNKDVPTYLGLGGNLRVFYAF